LFAHAGEPHRGRDSVASLPKGNEHEQHHENSAERIASTACQTTAARKRLQEIGAVWPHKDGKGFNLAFATRPLEGAAIVLRMVKGTKGGAQ